LLEDELPDEADESPPDFVSEDEDEELEELDESPDAADESLPDFDEVEDDSELDEPLLRLSVR
jgi:hypothetical protein